MNRGIFQKISEFFHHRRLRFDIVTGFLFLFVSAAVLILGYTYQGAKKTSINFAEQLLKQITETTTEKTSNYLGDAKSAAVFANSLIDLSNSQFMEDEKLRANFIRILELYPYFNVIQVALSNGDYLSVERVHPGTKYVTTPDRTLHDNIVYLSQYQNRSSKEHQPQEIWTYYDKEGKVVSQEANEFLVYDGRKRPWYINTDQKRKFNWSPVYTFSFMNVPGITAALPLFAKEGEQEKLIGVIGVDVSLEEVSQFLQKNKVSPHGASFVLNETSQLVASSNPQHLISKDPRSDSIINISDIDDENLKEAYAYFKSKHERTFQFIHHDTVYLNSFSHLKIEGDSLWLVGVVVPIDDFLAEAKKIGENVIFMALISLLLSSFLIILLSKRISKPIMAVANETQKIQNLDISGDFQLRSDILEIQLMLSSIASMRKSLLSFSKFVPKSLVQKLVQKGGEIRLGGRKKELTIFFSDIANFTNISETLPPEKLVNHLSSYFDELSKILTESNGTIDKYIGDAIMAFWGAPISDRDQTFNACRAALLCQKRLAELNRQWELEGKPVFHTRIGIHRDEVIVGIIGSQEKMNYTVMGDGVNAASRLEGLNKFYGTSVLVSEKIFEQVEESFLFRPLDIIAVKGKKKPLKIYEIMAQNKGDASLLPSEAQRQISDLFAKAFRLYCLQKWDEALERFQEIHTLFPQDYVTTIYLERCKEFKIRPPSVDWDGVTSFTHK